MRSNVGITVYSESKQSKLEAINLRCHRVTTHKTKHLDFVCAVNMVVCVKSENRAAGLLTKSTTELVAIACKL